MAALHERMDGIGRETLRIARQADDFLGRLEQVEGLCEHLTETWHAGCTGDSDDSRSSCRTPNGRECQSRAG